VPLSKYDSKLLKEYGVTSLNDSIKSDVRRINLENEDLSNLNLNIINFVWGTSKGDYS